MDVKTTQNGKARFGAMILAYNQADYIDACIRAIYPYFYRIVVMYSKAPYSKYNTHAREEFTELDNTLEILEGIPDKAEKMMITHGSWTCQEDIRNDALDIMRTEGCDYCFVIDADEFYPDCMLPGLFAYLEEHLPEGQVGWVKTRTLFKQMNYLIDTRRARLAVATRIRPETRFTPGGGRGPTGEKFKVDDRFFYWHLGYVLPNKRMWEKVRTYGHARELPPDWYEEKWLNWTPETTNMCRRDPTRWPKTVRIEPRELPGILHNHPYFPYGPEGPGESPPYS